MYARDTNVKRVWRAGQIISAIMIDWQLAKKLLLSLLYVTGYTISERHCKPVCEVNADLINNPIKLLLHILSVYYWPYALSVYRWDKCVSY